MTTKPKYQIKSPIVTPFCTISIVDERILVNKFHHDAFIGLEEMRELSMHMEKVTQGEPFLILIDLSNKYVHFNEEARAFAANGPLTNKIIKQAIVVNTLALKMVTNFFFRFNRPHFPSRAFNSIAPAKKWLLQS